MKNEVSSKRQKKVRAQLTDGDILPFLGEAMLDQDRGVFWPKDATNLDIFLDRKITLQIIDEPRTICITLKRRPMACQPHYHFFIID